MVIENLNKLENFTERNRHHRAAWGSILEGRGALGAIAYFP